MHYFISAGEASGDIHAAGLIDAIKRHDDNATFTFLGGDKMAKAAEGDPLIHIRDMAFMGFVDVVAHLDKVLNNLKNAQKELRRSSADALIVVDYPSFNLKLAKTANKLNIPVYSYISPKVWAWKEHRVPEMKRLYKKIFSILPFEIPYFKRKDVPQVEYVGNPSREEIDSRLGKIPGSCSFRQSNNLDNRPILALVPGSRVGEIKRNLPVMAAVAKRHPEYQAVVAGAPSIDPQLYSGITDFPVIENNTFALMANAFAALVTSGTATLECALADTPQVACYRSMGSKLIYKLFRGVIKTRFVTLPNLIADSEVIPEMLMHRCNPDDVDDALTPLLDPDSATRNDMKAGYARIREMLGTTPAADTTAKLIVSDLNDLKQTAKQTCPKLS